MGAKRFRVFRGDDEQSARVRKIRPPAEARGDAGPLGRPEHHVGGRGVFAVAAELKVERVAFGLRARNTGQLSMTPLPAWRPRTSSLLLSETIGEKLWNLFIACPEA